MSAFSVLLKSELGKAVLGDPYLCTGLLHLHAQTFQFGNGQTGIVSHDDRPGALKGFGELADDCSFFPLYPCFSPHLHPVIDAGCVPIAVLASGFPGDGTTVQCLSTGSEGPKDRSATGSDRTETPRRTCRPKNSDCLPIYCRPCD